MEMWSTVAFVISVAIVSPAVGAKFPDPKTDPLLFIANPVEANMPGHWVPLSIVKAMLGQTTKPPKTTSTPAPAKPLLLTDPPPTPRPATTPEATEAPEPEATEPPATEPPATEPPATDAPATDLPATDPPATDPPATEPPATEAAETTEPPPTEPATTEAEPTEPEPEETTVANRRPKKKPSDEHPDMPGK